MIDSGGVSFVNERGTRRATAVVIVAVLAVCALAVVLRVAPVWTRTVEQGVALVDDPDAAYHLRRAARIVDGFPTLAVFDPFIAYPAGAFVIWPPLYDLVLAGATALAPVPPGADGASVPVAFLPPLLFAACLLTVWWWSRLVIDDPWLRVAALAIVAVLPASMPYTRLALLDHHAAELLCVAAVVGSHAWALGRLRDGSPARLAWPPGVALAAALLVQLASSVLLVLLPLSAALLPAVDRRRGFRLAAMAMGVALILVLPWSAVYALAGAPFAHHQFGLFHAALVALVAVSCVAAERLGDPRRRWLGWLAAAVALLGWLALGRELVGGTGFVLRGSRWLQDIGESRSLLSIGWRQALLEVGARLSFLAPIVPVAAVAWCAGSRRRPERLPIGLAALAFTVLAVAQARFVPHVALFVGVAVVWALARWTRALRRRPLRIGVGVAVVALALLPTAGGWGRVEGPGIAFRQARPVLQALAARDADSEAPPGVFATWSWGHFIQQYGRHPAVLDNFGEHVTSLAVGRDVFLSESVDRAMAALDSLGVRYVLVGDLVEEFAGVLPEPQQTALYIAGARFGERDGAIQFAPHMGRTVLYRLAWKSGGVGDFDPVRGSYLPPFPGLRLIAESDVQVSPTDDWQTPAIKLFERVAGVRIEVLGCSPRETGGLFATIETPSGRRFPFVLQAIAGADGAWSLSFPYATTGAIHCVEGEIKFREGTLKLPPISDEAVQSGGRVQLNRHGG